MDKNARKLKSKGKTCHRPCKGVSMSQVRPVPAEELKEVPDEGRLVALVMLIKLIEELVRGLNSKERETWWRIFIEGKSKEQTAASEGVSRQAIYSRLDRMIQHHDYTEIASRCGRLRPRVNQHEFRSTHNCRPRTEVPRKEIDCWESEGGALADGPHFW